MFICFFPGSRVATDQRVVAKQDIQEVESAKRAKSEKKGHEDMESIYTEATPNPLP